MTTLKFKLDVSETVRREMYHRTHELCRATNVRMYREPWSESDWSSYQSFVVSSILGLSPDPKYVEDGKEVTTKKDQWRAELGIVTSALNETMNEFPDAMSAKPATPKDPLH